MYLYLHVHYYEIFHLFQTTKAFLGDMVKRGRGHIVTVASLAGLMGTYRCTDYSATKFAAVGFHESLFTELRVRIINRNSYMHDKFTRLHMSQKL